MRIGLYSAPRAKKATFEHAFGSVAEAGPKKNQRMMTMTSKVIPKERLSEYQRSEMDAFERAFQPPMADAGNEKEEDEGTVDTKVMLPTVEQIERIHQQAQQEGHAAGYEAGFNAGHQTALQAGNEQMATEVVKLQELLTGFER